MLLAVACLLPTLSAGQRCSALNDATVEQLVDYLQHPADDAATASCVQATFRLIASLPPRQAIPLLISYLGYKRPLTESERSGYFMHGNGPNVLYPAVHELRVLGSAAEPAILDTIAEGKNRGVALENALFTLLLIHQGDAVAVIRELRKKSVSSTTLGATNRLQSAVNYAMKWCDERSNSQCNDASE
ncbi:MAG: hypothetical protein WBV69_12650 [Candidatus Sulfotelmatobacter sp.]